ncbi:DUF4249 domain-containing protein [Gaoshiqia sp. Z1-71]|uniref:DUF4249 domain-containing protein n=1 Tax=Gaoshiqia hydrogeniformans TaxID=3290090 RepID=UPI003BF8F1F6
MKYAVIIIITILFFQSCTERVDIDLEQAGESRLVVFGEITSDVKAHAVYLTKSMPYFYNEETPVVSGAIVHLSDGTTNTQLVEDPANPGVYLTPDSYAGVPGRTYRLSIEQVDINEDGTLESYAAETWMKNVTQVDAVGVTYNSRWDGWEVELYADEPGETEDYYLFKVYKNGVLYTDTISNYWTADDRFFNGNRIDGAMVQYFDEEKDELVEPGDVIMLEVAGITKEYYDFINALQQEINGKVPIFSGPSANVKGNISNGALGFFAVMSVSRGSCVYVK